MPTKTRKPKLQVANDPMNSAGIANKLTDATIKQILWDGTPDWFSHPEDYKQFAAEDYLSQRETSTALSREYRMEDQAFLADEGPRKVNVMSTLDFLLKLKRNGITVGAEQIQGEPQLAGMWAMARTPDEGWKPVCVGAIQLPAMYEWSVLRINEYGVADGEKFIGWRTALCSLITKGAITEEKAHEIFGKPTEGPVSRKYRKTLHKHRNSKASQN